MLEKPLGVALIICDQVITDTRTAKRSLVGIFNQIKASKFPCRHPHLAVFAQLTNGSGTQDVILRCGRRDDESAIFEIEHPIEFPNPMAVIEIEFLIEGAIFKTTGSHVFELLVGGELVLETPFMVLEKEEE